MVGSMSSPPALIKHRIAPVRGLRRRTGGAWALLAVALVVSTLVMPQAGAQEPVPSPVSDQDPQTEMTPEERERAERIRVETLALAPESPAAPDDAFHRLNEAEAAVDDAALARMVATQRSNDANGAFAAATEALGAAQQHTDLATATRRQAIDHLAEERDRLSGLTVRAYVSNAEMETDEFGALLSGDTTNAAGGRALMFEQVLDRQVQATESAERDLDQARSALEISRSAMQAARLEAARRGELAWILAQEVSRTEVDHHDAQVEMVSARGAIGGQPRGLFPPLEIPLIGPTRLTAEDLASWFRSSPYSPRVDTPIEDFARWFIAEGETEGIRGDVAFAQAVLETGGFANNDTVLANNYSGIGHCDSCAAGWRFPSPQMGVRAQIQLLKSYAIAGPEYVHPLVDGRLRGPSGCCQTWGELTTVWATDTGYGLKVMVIYSSMVDHALDRRARGEGFEG